MMVSLTVTLVIDDLTFEKEMISKERDSLYVSAQKSSLTNLTTVVEKEHSGWLAGLWMGIKNAFAVLGLLCALWLGVKYGRKFIV